MKLAPALLQTRLPTLRNSVRPLLHHPQPHLNLRFHTSPLLRLLSRHSRHPRHHKTSRLLFKRLPTPKRLASTTSKPPLPAQPTTSLTLTQRMRKLSREYGWSALGVYLLLSAVDFPFCFLAVRWLGTARIGHWEHMALEWFWSVVPYRFPARETNTGGEEVISGNRSVDHGVDEAELMNQREDASIYTQLALAYAVHKSFIFVRIPLTAAVTPKVVKVLRGWGWDIGKRRSKTAAASSAAGKGVEGGGKG